MSFEEGWGAVAPLPPRKKKKRKKKEKKRKKENKEKKERKGTMNNVKLLHIKCCFFKFFSSPVALKNKKNFGPPKKKLKWRPWWRVPIVFTMTVYIWLSRNWHQAGQQARSQGGTRGPFPLPPPAGGGVPPLNIRKKQKKREEQRKKEEKKKKEERKKKKKEEKTNYKRKWIFCCHIPKSFELDNAIKSSLLYHPNLMIWNLNRSTYSGG